ncbi:hypothetical protein B6A10_11695 [Flavobacterium sp. L1I52]|uniref:FecR family protein n=1 Tax=Flavobacterium pokkalii TaxID=1940408 RepID=A0ABR7USS5_9FLAO|nr:FecR family protein [Flavobacterium pokkalii]MBD0725845.1 hypothetical protein [Flavobacterium pokkalii]
MKDIFSIANLKIKKVLKILSDSEKSELESLYEKYPFSKKIKISKLIDDLEMYSKNDKIKAWKTIELKIQKQNNKSLFVLNNKLWLKYTAAAILILALGLTYVFKTNLFQNKYDRVPKLVNVNNVIIPGSNKATLTLADGSVVTLEKGSSYQTQNAKSNGEEIVYNQKSKTDETVLFNYLTIPRGGQFHLVLADGTEVWLNSETQLKFPVSFVEGENRKVELVYGEAYFDVSPSTNHKGSKFKVLNKSQEIEVLGTEFNVKAYKDESNIYTTLVEGKVSIKTEKSKDILRPSEQSNLNLKTYDLSISEVNVYGEVSWKDGIFSFKGKTLKEIMKVISRWYDVEVVFEDKNLEQVKFRGTLNKNQSIEEILLIMKSYSVNNYQIKGKTIILK